MRTYAALGAIIGWLAVTGQFYLIILNRTATIPETVVRFSVVFISIGKARGKTLS